MYWKMANEVLKLKDGLKQQGQRGHDGDGAEAQREDGNQNGIPAGLVFFVGLGVVARVKGFIGHER